MTQPNFRPLGCSECLRNRDLGFDFSMAFQPIVDYTSGATFAFEALVRGLDNEPAGQIIGQVNTDNRYFFDQSCRVKAVELASRLGMDTHLSINFMPNAVYQPELCIRTTVAAAETWNFPVERIIFEVTEGEQVVDHAHLRDIIQTYQDMGFMTAIDDFGAGYSGLNLLADFQPDLIKLDMALIRNIDRDRGRQSIVRAILQICDEFSIRTIAEGVESRAELDALLELGIVLFQGYHFARPGFESLPEVPKERFRRED